MTEYQVEVKPEVIELKIENKPHEVPDSAPFVEFMAEDHCLESENREMIVDAGTGKEEISYKAYLEFDSLKLRQTEDLMGRNKVVMPAKIKASFLIRDLIKDIIKPFHADKILREKVEITKLTLLFRPSWVFEFTQQSNGKQKALEIDGLTGELRTGTVTKKEMKEVFTEGELFKLGKEMTYTVIPGAEATELLVKHIVKKRKEKKVEKVKKQLRDAKKKEIKAKPKKTPKSKGRTRLSLAKK